MTIKQVTREQWTAALRSGEYRQGTGQLYLNNKGENYCCLGVLGVLAGGKRINECGPWGGLDFPGYKTDGAVFLPNELASMVGLSSEAQRELANLNDFGHRNFSEIADYIDELPFDESLKGLPSKAEEV